MDNYFSIIGGTGYAAGELLRLLYLRKDLKLHSVVSQSKAGVRIADSHSFLQGFFEQAFDATLPALTKPHARHIVFLSLPHELTLEAIQTNKIDLEDPNLLLIDLAGDFRISAPKVHEAHYKNAPICPELRGKFVYGLAELNRKELQNARLIACPGCSATACTLAVLPLKNSYTGFRVTFDVKNGTSGAGRKESPLTHHPLRGNSLTVYKVLTHRHEPEILQNLGDPYGERISSLYVPHLLPFSRGIFVTAYIELDEQLDLEKMYDLYEAYYDKEPFVRVRRGQVELNDVVASNYTDIYLYCRGKHLVVVSMLDNLMKGAAGQALQNMNIALGLNEREGLDFPSLPWI